MPPWRVRHAQALGQHLVGRDVHQDAARGLGGTPAQGLVAVSERRDIARHPIAGTKAIEVAFVQRLHQGDEGRLPHRLEALVRRLDAQARELGVDEMELAATHLHLVDVHVPREVDVLGQVAGIKRPGLIQLVCDGLEIAELIDAMSQTGPQGATSRMHAHGPGKVLGSDVEPPLVLAHQHHLAALIGRHGDGEPELAQQRHQVHRIREVDLFRACRWLCHGARGRSELQVVGH